MGSVAKKLGKGSLLRSINLLMAILIGFFMLPFLVHSLGDEQYGIWVLVGSIIGFYGLLDVGLGSAITRFIVRAMHGENDKDDGVNIALSSSVFLFSGVGLISLVLTFGIILSVPLFTDSAVNSSLAQLLIGILGLKVSILFPLTSFNSVLIAKYRFDILSYIQMFSLVLRTSFIVVFVSNGFDIVAVAIIIFVDAVIVSICAIYFSKRLFPQLKVSISLVSSKKILKYYNYGKFTYIATIADKIRFSIDDLVVGAFIGVGAVTHYTIAVAFQRYFGQFMGGVFGVIAPALNKYHKLNQWDNLREVFLVATELSVMMSVLIGGLLLLLGEPFIIVWVGDEYRDVYFVLVILSVAGIVANSQRTCVAVLYAIAKHKYYAKITSIEAIFNAAISIILVQYIGIIGVALGTAIPILYTKLLLQPLYTCKQLDISFKSYNYLIFKYFFFGASFFLPIYILIHSIMIDTYLKLFAVSSITGVMYTLICVRYLFSPPTIEYIDRMIPDKARFLLRFIL